MRPLSIDAVDGRDTLHDVRPVHRRGQVPAEPSLFSSTLAPTRGD
jgi:hypothetical protein